MIWEIVTFIGLPFFNGSTVLKKNETVFHYCVHPVKCVQSEAFTNENPASTVEQQRLATAFVLELTLS